MSRQPVYAVVLRVRDAEEDSPIAVFLQKDEKTGQCHLDAVFANTFLTRNRIQSKDANLIGVFDRRANLGDLTIMLKACLDAGENMNNREVA